MKIRPLGAELFHTDGQTEKDRYDEANSRFSQFYERTKSTFSCQLRPRYKAKYSSTQGWNRSTERSKGA